MKTIMKSGWIAAAVLASSQAAGAEEPIDARTELALTPEARNVVLTEMRGFVSGLQRITGALSEEDMQTVAEVARSLGTTAARETPPEVLKQLPAEFRKLGFQVHSDFDRIAADAEAMEDPGHTLRQVSEAMNGCVACHAAYQIRVTE